MDCRIFASSSLPILQSKIAKHERLISFASSIICLAFGFVLLVALVKQRTFIPDEAWFAENLVKRPFFHLFDQPFIHEQTAPALYSLFAKGCGSLFEYSAFGLRLSSFLAWIAVLMIARSLLRSSFALPKSWAAGGLALLSSMPVVLRYGTELKPYIVDVLCILLIIVLQTKATTRKTSPIILTLAFCLCFLFSTAAFFFVSGTLLTAFAANALKRRRQEALHWFSLGITFLIFAALYYVLWLKPVAENTGMQTFWKGRWFLRLGFFETAACLFGGSLLLIPPATIGWINGLRRRDGFSACVAISVLLALTASAVGKYPISDRLWLFLRVVTLLYAVSGTRIAWIFLLAKISARSYALPTRIATAFLCFSLPFALFARNVVIVATDPSKIGTAAAKKWDYNPLVAWLRSHAEDETVYVSMSANIAVRSQFGFADESTIRFGELGSSVIWGAAAVHDSPWAEAEAEKISHFGQAYVVLNTDYDATLLDALTKRGFVHETGRMNETPLLYFSTVQSAPNLAKEATFR